jgi:FixJ family two-component response regulator
MAMTSKFKLPENFVDETQARSGEILGIAGAAAAKAAADRETVLKNLTPRERQLVENVLENHPLLSVSEAIEMLKYFGGL